MRIFGTSIYSNYAAMLLDVLYYLILALIVFIGIATLALILVCLARPQRTAEAPTFPTCSQAATALSYPRKEKQHPARLSRKKNPHTLTHQLLGLLLFDSLFGE